MTASLTRPAEHLPVATAAREYRETGVALTRIRPGKKQPSDPGWTTRSAEPDEFRHGDNVGLLCGWLSDGGVDGRSLVCVDLDSKEALEQADRFLPDTGAIEGRPGKPRSHRWYFVTDVPGWATSTARASAPAAGQAGKHPGPKTFHLKHRETRAGVLDFLGSGGQAVAPPSHHASGEVRAWEPGHSIDRAAVVTFEALWAAVAALAEACGANVPQPPTPKPPRAKKGGVGPGRQRPEGPTVPRAVGAGSVQGTGTRIDVPMAERVAKCRQYIQTAPLARSGHGGHDTTFAVARAIVNDYAVDDRTEAMALLAEYNRRLVANQLEAWTMSDLEHKLDGALDAPLDPRFPYGAKLENDPPAGAWGDPGPLADRFVAARPVLYWSGRHFRFNGRHYDEVDPNALKAELYGFLEGEARRHPPPPPRVSRNLRDNVLAAVEARGASRVAGLGHLVAPNTWLPGAGRSGDVLVVGNGLLEVGSKTLLPHTEDFFALYALPYAFDPAATCPKWEAAVGRICGGDEGLVRLLRQWFGYCLTTGTDEQRFLVLEGEGANGKSTLIGGLLAVVGEGNASHVPLERFGEAFDLGYTLGKLVNVPDDMAEVDKAAEGVLKTYTSGGAMTFNQKHRAIVQARPTAKLMFATNAMPRFTDRSGGLWRRILQVHLTTTFGPGERVRGMDKPAYWAEAGELPGMLNWALAGLADLRAAGEFVVPECVKRRVAEQRRESNPAQEFLAEHLRAEPGAVVPSKELYTGYTKWAKENGYQPLGHTQFTKDLRRMYPEAERKNDSVPTDKRKRQKVICGVTWSEEGEEYAQAA